MSFGEPRALGLLLLAVPIVWAHFVRLRSRPVAVPWLRFWQEAAQEERRITALHLLQRRLALLLELVLLAALVWWLASPRFESSELSVSRTALVLDTSPKMAAGDRMERARGRIEKWLDGLDPSTETALFDSAGVLVPFPGNRERMRRKLKEPVRWRVGSPNMAEVVRRMHPGAKVILFSDAAPIENRSIRLEEIRKGGAVLLLSGTEGEAILKVTADGEASASVPVRIPGRTEVGLPAGEKIMFRIEPGDAFAWDDAACWIRPGPEQPRVLVVHGGEPDPFLVRALEILREAEEIASVGGVTADRFVGIASRIDARTLVIVDGVAFDPPAAGTILSFGGSSPLWSMEEAAGPWRIRNRRPGHPLFRSIDPTGLSIRSSRRVVGGEEVLQTEHGPVAATGRKPGLAWAAFGFRLEESDLRFQAAFPLLLRNSVHWVREGSARLFEPAVSSGSRVVFRSALKEPPRKIRLRYGETEDWRRCAADGPAEPLVVPGFYRIEVEGRREWVAVSSPPFRGDGEAFSEPEAPARAGTGSGGAWWGAALFLGLLLTEWLLYRREPD